MSSSDRLRRQLHQLRRFPRAEPLLHIEKLPGDIQRLHSGEPRDFAHALCPSP